MATVQEVVAALEALDLAVAVGVTKPDQDGSMEFINVFGENRFQVLATVWPPNDGGDGWAWGDKYQWSAYPDDDAETVAAKISRSLTKPSKP